MDTLTEENFLRKIYGEEQFFCLVDDFRRMAD